MNDACRRLFGLMSHADAGPTVRVNRERPSVFLVALVSLLVGRAVLLPVAAYSEDAREEGRATVIVAVGAAGEDGFALEFERWARLWESAAARGGARCIIVGLDPPGETSDLDRLEQVLDEQNKRSVAELWLVLIGHGTFDGREARFNLRGPDFSAGELASWLKPFQRPLAVINCASASAPFIKELSGPDRVIITATRSGYEQNYARFGQHLAEAVADPAADLDKDGQTSLLEAFLMASRRVAEFYEAEGRLATEHALLDDNGDGLGTPADWFRGIRAVRKAADDRSADGLRAHQFHMVRSEQERKMPAETRARRDELELAIARLRDTRETHEDQDDYYNRLERLLLELAALYSRLEP